MSHKDPKARAAYMRDYRQRQAAKAGEGGDVDPPATPPKDAVNPGNPPPEPGEGQPRDAKLAAKGNGSKSTLKKIATSTIQPGQTVRVVPREFTMTSTVLWQAREAAIREMGWPADITVEDFVDTWFALSFKANGIVLAGYVKVDNNGHKTYTEEEVAQVVRKAIEQLTGKEAGDGS